MSRRTVHLPLHLSRIVVELGVPAAPTTMAMATFGGQTISMVERFDRASMDIRHSVDVVIPWQRTEPVMGIEAQAFLRDFHVACQAFVLAR